MISNRAIRCFVAPRCSLATLTCSERRVCLTDIIKTRSKSVPNKGGKETAEEGKHGFGDSRGPAVSEDWSRRTAVYPSGTMGLKVATGFASGGGICIHPKKTMHACTFNLCWAHFRLTMMKICLLVSRKPSKPSVQV